MDRGHDENADFDIINRRKTLSPAWLRCHFEQVQSDKNILITYTTKCGHVEWNTERLRMYMCVHVAVIEEPAAAAAHAVRNYISRASI